MNVKVFMYQDRISMTLQSNPMILLVEATMQVIEEKVVNVLGVEVVQNLRKPSKTIQEFQL